MSVKIMSWAWSQKIEPTRKLILMALADHADDDGVCWPSMKKLADKCSVSRRTVLRNINALKEDGIISSSHRHREDGSMSSSKYVIHADNQSHPLRQNVTPPCDTHDTPPATRVSHHEPSLQPSIRIKDIDHFEEFWVQCPRRIGKGAARKAFKTALTKASFTEIMAGMHRHAAAVDGSDIKYVPHPATWLNAERWSDQNEPSNKAQGKSAGNHGDIFDIATEVLARRKARRELRADGIQDNGEADAGTTPRIEGPDRGDIQATVRRTNHDGAAATQSYHQGAVYEFQ